MNKVILIGRTTKDPEMRYTASGNANTTFTLAVERDFKGQDGKKETDFIRCVCWRKLAELVAEHVAKGALIAIEGRIQTRTYDGRDGKKQYVTEVVAGNVQFLERKKVEGEWDNVEEVPF